MVGMTQGAAAEEGNAADADEFQELVDDAQVRVEHPEPDQRDDDVGDEVGQQQDPAGERRGRDLLHQQGDRQRENGLHHDVDQHVLQRHQQRLGQHRVAEHLLVVGEADPFRRAVAAVVVGEAQVDTPERRPDEEHAEADQRREDEPDGGLEVADVPLALRRRDLGWTCRRRSARSQRSCRASTRMSWDRCHCAHSFVAGRGVVVRIAGWPCGPIAWPYGRTARARTMWVYSGNIAGICTPTWASVRPDSVTPSFHHPGYWFVPG